MFTRCPDCRTVFHITAAELRAADGTVVCGACGTTFDALESLSETRPSDPAQVATPAQVAAPAPASVPETPDDLPGDEMEAGARDEDEFLQELESLIGSGEPLEVESFGRELFELEPETSLRETHGPVHGNEPAEDVLPEELPQGPADEHVPEALPEEADEHVPEALPEEPPEEPPEALPEDLPEDLPSVAAADLVPEEFFATSPEEEELPPSSPEDEDPISALDEGADELDDFPDPDSVFRVDELDETFADDPSSPFVSEDDPSAWPREYAAAGHATEKARETGKAGETDGIDETVGNVGADEIDEPDRIAASAGSDERTEAASPAVLAAPDVPEEFAPPPPPRGRWAKISLALVGILVLTGAWAHLQHGKLLRHPAGQAVLAPIYATLGIAATPDWNPAEFRALRWEAIAAADQPDVLIVAVDFMNAAAYPQPYPVIRVILEGRDGRRVGMHDVLPAQYLEDHANGRRLAANGRVQATVTVPDPGARADGFRLDFCLEIPDRGLVCGPAPFR